MKVIGVMSGSSLDGIDIVLTHFDKGEWQLESTQAFPLPDKLKDRLRKTVDSNALALAQTESQYSAFISNCILQFIGTDSADLIGIHGHTILHLPEIKTSWQLLNGGMVASMTKLPVVCDFRNQDLALGGEGTPMAVIADRDLYPGYEYYVNLGGIANISYIKKGKWIAYDICPCNQLLNHFSQKLGKEYDAEGAIARTGHLNNNLLELLMDDPYLKKAAPKSLDNSYIQNYLINKLEALKLSTADYLRTITEYIAEVISLSAEGETGSLFLSGGGTKNDFLIALLNEKLALKNMKVHIPDAETVDFKEAILIAYCAYLRIKKQPNFITAATGASQEMSGGAVYLPPYSSA